MGNHTTGQFVGRMAMEAERNRKHETAMDILDRICRNLPAGCTMDAEFEAIDPDNPNHCDPVCDDYRDVHPDRPVAALGRLLLEAFMPHLTIEEAVERYNAYAAPDDDDAQARAELASDRYWDELITPFNARYGFC